MGFSDKGACIFLTEWNNLSIPTPIIRRKKFVLESSCTSRLENGNWRRITVDIWQSQFALEADVKYFTKKDPYHRIFHGLVTEKQPYSVCDTEAL